MELDPYIAAMTGAGLLILMVAWLPMLLKELPLSLPIFCVAAGYGLFLFIGHENPHPLRFPETAERLTELVVIVSLTGCGLKLDRPIGREAWQVTWRLLGVAMPLSILALALLGWSWMGTSLSAAVLLGAALAPTDPVLASDIQVGPPGSGEEDEVRFSLTSEAGLNDGLAFPFVNLAVAIALHGAAPGDWTWHWLGVDVLWKVGAGIAMGVLVGWGLGYLTFNLPNRARLSRTGDGFLALAMTFLAYGLTEIIHGYGFLAVFVAALVFRRTEGSHDYHDKLHGFAEEVERLLMMLLLVLFGGALAEGLLNALTWEAAVGGLVFLFLIRPAAVWLSALGLKRPPLEVLAIGFFGIRGLGSFYYVSYGLNKTEWQEAEAIWATVGFVVLVSVVLHGTTVTPAMRLLDRRRTAAERRAARKEGAPVPG
ncbi:cation:proton antiporter [Azospirillum sp. SYSU D00513]|uniref:cation:proton antiporter n=1 Tax=Azospirillum sp. SYSU D00513 TaxID=2812561 RepID=UPI0032B3BC1F